MPIGPCRLVPAFILSSTCALTTILALAKGARPSLTSTIITPFAQLQRDGVLSPSDSNIWTGVAQNAAQEDAPPAPAIGPQ